MTEYQKLPICIKGSTSNGVCPRWEKLKLDLCLKDGSKRLVLNLVNTFYILNNFCNLVSLTYLNNSRIFHNNKDDNLYYVKICQVLIQAPQ